MADVDDFLAHYGVKGMRWGKRKGRKESAPRAEGYSDRMVKSDMRYLGGKKGVERVNQKVAEGKTLKKAREEVRDQRANKKLTMAAVGYTAAYVALRYGPVIARMAEIGLNEAVMSKQRSNGAKAAARVFADERSRSHGLSTGPTIRLQQNPTTGNWV